MIRLARGLLRCYLPASRIGHESLNTVVFSSNILNPLVLFGKGVERAVSPSGGGCF